MSKLDCKYELPANFVRAVPFFSTAFRAEAAEAIAVIAVEDVTTALSATLLLITAAIAVEDEATAAITVEDEATAAIAVEEAAIAVIAV